MSTRCGTNEGRRRTDNNNRQTAAGSSDRGRTSKRSGVSFETGVGDERRRVTINQVVDPSDDGRFTTSEPNGRAFDDRLPELAIPASGEPRTDPACGDEIPALFCPDCGEPHHVGATCRQSTCPHCWQAWDFHRVTGDTGIASKLESLRGKRYQQDGKWWKHHHVVVSFRDNVRFDAGRPIERGIEAVKALMADVNVDTGYIVYHPYRIVNEYRGEVNGHDSGEGEMTWKDVLSKLESDDWTWEAIRSEFLMYSPHFHVIALSEFVQGQAVTEKIEDETGVVIERITAGDSSTSIEDLEDLTAVLQYSLSHCGLEQTGDRHRAMYRPFGEVANHKAEPWAIKRVDTAARASSWDVLGVDFDKPTCDAEHEHEHDDADEIPAVDERPTSPPAPTPAVADGGSQLGGAGTVDLPVTGAVDLPDSGRWDTGPAGGRHAVADGVSTEHPPDPPTEVVGPTEANLEPCGATLRPMFTVDRYLEDNDWRSSIGDGALERLTDARDEWDALGKPAPEEIPPDRPG